MKESGIKMILPFLTTDEHNMHVELTDKELLCCGLPMYVCSLYEKELTTCHVIVSMVLSNQPVTSYGPKIQVHAPLNFESQFCFFDTLPAVSVQ